MERGPITEPSLGLRGIEAIRLLDTDIPQSCAVGFREDMDAMFAVETSRNVRCLTSTGSIAERARVRS
ncbi:hypothetical protein ABID21_000682 [Pseudorhizobium tarimense]|uniref:Uncharacterized protein n=1 Tax=Pseudorhizobium tarimense TaxID=1079109 RepID=A0ABV2H2S7_9HYPH|nr:hypothetical protein [Pseudorhizobium tarimense]MCJ8517803.1 hypothetical protein [Pseudorhizobium tarimense]